MSWVRIGLIVFALLSAYTYVNDRSTFDAYKDRAVEVYQATKEVIEVSDNFNGTNSTVGEYNLTAEDYVNDSQDGAQETPPDTETETNTTQGTTETVSGKVYLGKPTIDCVYRWDCNDNLPECDSICECDYDTGECYKWG